MIEQAAGFFGPKESVACIPATPNDPADTFHKRLIDLMSHGDYALYEPHEMMGKNKQHFRRIFNGFVHTYPFGPEPFNEEPAGGQGVAA